MNDTHGHKRGDAVLSDVAYEIRKSLRSFELVYRIGGEEFLVLLPGVDLTEALEIAERVRHAVAGGAARAASISRSRRAWPPTPAATSATTQLFRAADAALLRGQARRPQPGGDRRAGCRASRSPALASSHGDPSAVRA